MNPMSTPHSQLDARLQALFGGIDTKPDFEVRLLARLHAESQPNSAERIVRARQEEQERHRSALRQLKGGRLSMLRALTLDAIAIAFPLVMILVSAWRHFRPQVVENLIASGPHIATLLGLLIAVLPLIAMRIERHRRPLEML